jgi:23S rRNA (uracil1939-C5)-methyltransferase
VFKKNDELELLISDLGTTGEGIGRVDGYVLFVKDTVIGDRVRVKVMKAKKNYGYARLIELLEPSPNRVEAPCPVARSCGGCQIQFMNYQEQLRFKEAKVFNNIKRIGGIDSFEMEPIIGMEEPFHYRNKAQFPVGLDKDGNIVSGFYAGRTHSIIDMEHCMLGICPEGQDVNGEIMKLIKVFMKQMGIKPYDEKTGKGLVRHVLIRIGKTTGQLMVCIVINGRKLPQANILVDALKDIPGMTDISLSVNTQRNNVIMGTEIISLFGPGYIEDYIGSVKFRISPLSFFQVNPEQTEKLYNKALEYAELTGNETVWDLYCGIGSISLFLAQKAKKVLGVEIVPEAIEDAKVNAKINGIENAEFFVGAAEEVVPKYFKEHPDAPECQPDVIVVDPPRKGCDEKLLETMVLMKPARIVYVSCDSASLARDLKWLSAKGYQVEKVTPCDQFGQTVHVETVALLTKNGPYESCCSYDIHRVSY